MDDYAQELGGMEGPLVMGQGRALPAQPPIQPSPSNLSEALVKHQGNQLGDQVVAGNKTEVPLQAGRAKPLNNAKGCIGTGNRRIGQATGHRLLCNEDAGGTLRSHEALCNGPIKHGHGVGTIGGGGTRLGRIIAEEGVGQNGSDMAVGRLVEGIVDGREDVVRR